ncbi:MAG: HAD family phosphatase [Bdellovibrionota bacterium]
MKLTIPSGPFEAYLFDLDGTIANSLPLHFKAWNEALAPHGTAMPEDLFFAWGGIPVPKTVEMLNDHFQIKLPIDVVSRAREQAYLEMINEVKAHEAVETIIRANYQRIPMAVVSGSARSSIVKTLTRLNLSEFFTALLGAEDYSKGKPDPEPFLQGARVLGVDPKKCLAFEDAEPGIQSALAAGMQVVRIPQRF